MAKAVKTPKQMASKIKALKKDISLFKRAKSVATKARSATKNATTAMRGPRGKKAKHRRLLQSKYTKTRGW